MNIYQKKAIQYRLFYIGRLKKRQLPTLPLNRSTIGVTRLNFSVRNGKRWIPRTITTLISFDYLIIKNSQFIIHNYQTIF